MNDATSATTLPLSKPARRLSITDHASTRGIGLCRTEHMFFEGDRIVPVREMILAEDDAGRRKALAKLLPIQRDHFAAILRCTTSFREPTRRSRRRRRQWV